jgi:hypothetical protein
MAVHYQSWLLCRGPQASAKPLRFSAKPLPSAALGKASSAKIRSAKTSLPRAVYRALDKAFTESPTLGKARNKKIRNKPEKNLIEEGPTGWPVRLHASRKSRHFSRRIRGYAIGEIRTRDLSLTRYLLCYLHYILTCVYMTFRLLKYYTKPSEN